MKATLAQRGYLALFSLVLLVGLATTLGHYLAPIPSPEQITQLNIRPGMSWYYEQMARYRAHPITTAAHVMLATAMVVLTVIQLLPGIRRRMPALHRWSGRAFMVLGTIIGVSGIVLSLVMPFGGISETIFVGFFATAFFYALWRGYRHIRRREVAQHRIWMLRMVAIGFAPMTMRPIYGTLLQFLEMRAEDLFTPMMVLATIINLVALQWWLTSRARA